MIDHDLLNCLYINLLTLFLHIYHCRVERTTFVDLSNVINKI